MAYTVDSKAHNYELGPHASYTWSASFRLDRPRAHDEIVHTLGSIVEKFEDPSYGISGAMRSRGTSATSFVLGLDPSRTFGTPSLEQCETIAAAISDIRGWDRQASREPAHRIIMGLRMGYESNAKVYSFEEALGIGRVCMAGLPKTFERAEAFSARHIPDEGARTHHEPAYIITGPVDMTEGALQMAYNLGQQRVVSEVMGSVTQVYQQRSS